MIESHHCLCKHKGPCPFQTSEELAKHSRVRYSKLSLPEFQTGSKELIIDLNSPLQYLIFTIQLKLRGMLIFFLHQISSELTKIICLFICMFYWNERVKSLFPSCACSSVCDYLHYLWQMTIIWDIVFRCVVSKVHPFEWTSMLLRLSGPFSPQPFCQSRFLFSPRTSAYLRLRTLVQPI